MRYAVAVLIAAAAACDSFTALDPSQLTFGGGDGLEADGTDGTGDSIDVFHSDADGTITDTVAVDSSDVSDGTDEDIVQTEEVDGGDIAGEEVTADGLDIEVLADADTTDTTDDAGVLTDGIDTPEVEAPDAVDSTDVVDDVEEPTDVPDLETPDTDGVDGTGDGSDVIIDPPIDIIEDVATADSTDTTGGNDDIGTADDVGPDPVDSVTPDDTSTPDSGENDTIDPPDTVIEQDVPVVDKCEGVICDISDPCAPESCDKDTGECVVTMPALADNVPCEDGDFCTVGDLCDAGVCLGGAVNFEVCQCTTTSDCAHLEDSTLCTKPVTCIANVCVLGALVHCDDTNPCTKDLCVASTGLCSFANIPACCRQNEECDDGNVCTQDWCELTPGPDQNMCFTSNLDVPCSDGDACTVGDHCSLISGACISGDVPPCDDGNVCTHSDTCVNGDCLGKQLDCSDNDPCTQNEGCAGGVCVTPTQTDCSDDDVCTLDACTAGVGCSHSTYDAFVVSESAGKFLVSGAFEEWISADPGFHAGPWCAVGSTCDKEIGIQLTGDSASLTIDLDAVGDPIGVPKVLEFTLQHHYDIVGSSFPTMEVRLDGNVIDSNVFDGPSEKYSRLQTGGTQPPLNLGTNGTVVITLKRNGAKVSTSPVFQQTFHFIGEVLVRDACH